MNGFWGSDTARGLVLSLVSLIIVAVCRAFSIGRSSGRPNPPADWVLETERQVGAAQQAHPRQRLA